MEIHDVDWFELNWIECRPKRNYYSEAFSSTNYTFDILLHRSFLCFIPFFIDEIEKAGTEPGWIYIFLFIILLLFYISFLLCPIAHYPSLSDAQRRSATLSDSQGATTFTVCLQCISELRLEVWIQILYIAPSVQGVVKQLYAANQTRVTGNNCTGLFNVHYTTHGTNGFTSHPKDEAIMVKCLANGHRHHLRNSNSHQHSAEHQSSSPVRLNHG